MSKSYARHIEELKSGQAIRFRPVGNSMSPIIESRQLVTVEPVKLEELRIGDVVLCKVHGRVFLHKVLGRRADGGTHRVQIGNNRGHVNGWTGSVYGRMTKVEA